jgi:hypothetical protein
MGIFKITIRKISSHTAHGPYPTKTSASQLTNSAVGALK